MRCFDKKMLKKEMKVRSKANKAKKKRRMKKKTCA